MSFLLRKIAYPLSFIAFICFSLSFVCAVEVATPPIEKKAVSKKQQRIDKKIDVLQYKIAKTKSDKRKKKLKGRLSTLKEKKQNNRNPVFAIVGFVFSIVSIVLLFAALIALLIAIATGNLLAATLLFYAGLGLVIIVLFYAGLGLALIGLGMSLAGLILGYMKPDQFNLKGMALAGAIISFCVLLIVLLALFA